MRILLTNHHLRRYGGSEIFTYTLALELARRGHGVDVFALKRGEISRRIGAFARAVRRPGRRYDLILASHSTCMKVIQERGVQGHLVQTCHGVFSEMEAPVPGADSYVAVSEEVRDALREKGFSAQVIRNGIDCRRFRPREPVGPRLERVLSLCQGREADALLEEACRRRGLSLVCMNKFRNGRWNVQDFMNEADLVVSLGRGAYEAMATGRPVLAMDSRAYAGCLSDGLVTPRNLTRLLASNVSGRCLRVVPDLDTVLGYFSGYDPGHAPGLRAFVEEHLNVVHQADRYLELLPPSAEPVRAGFWDRLRGRT